MLTAMAMVMAEHMTLTMVIAINMARTITESMMMAIAMAASASFTSPISHPANILVMGPGGYRFIDYLKVGVPLTIVVFIAVMILLPFFWPLEPI